MLAGFIEPAAAAIVVATADAAAATAAAADDSESPRFLTKRTECISISGDIPRSARREDSPRRLPFVRGELVSLITVSGS